MRHPVSVCVPVNHTVTLSVRAEGTGLLRYQWFTDDENVVCEVCGLHACRHTLSLLRDFLFEKCVFGEQIWLRFGIFCLGKHENVVGKCEHILLCSKENNTHIWHDSNNTCSFNANKLAALYETQSVLILVGVEFSGYFSVKRC